MRLLNVKTLHFTDFQDNAKLPHYVIASHRWAANEATYRDVRDGCNKDKAGYKKVEAFAKYVREVVRYVEWLWIDTCCINKDSDAELSSAINSMFKWYRNAELCIAYLPDVNTADSTNREFRDSRWFTRGWTLQELLAPRIVVFVTNGWEVIGNKGASFHNYDKITVGSDLSERIAGLTRLPEHILHDWAKAVSISTIEKLKWMDGRTTTLAEDKAYALFGIVGVTLNVIYGEGYDSARQRLLGAIEQKEKLTTHNMEQFQKIEDWLSPPNPWSNHESARTIHERGTGSWLVRSSEYQAWKSGLSRHLWVHGKAGCGKTVLCSTAIEDIRAHCDGATNTGQAIFYFSFSDKKKQSFENLLRSLVAQLGWKEPGLDVIRQAYERPDRRSLGQEDLYKMLLSIVGSYSRIFVHIDGLDECPESDGLRQSVLRRIYELSQHMPSVKILATSRDISDVRDLMDKLTATSIQITGRTVQPDIQQYISTQLSLSQRMSRLVDTKRRIIEETLSQRADGMFRWVYCQLQQLTQPKSTRPSEILQDLEDLPKTLDETYDRMLNSIATRDRNDACTLLRWLTYAKSPLSLNELAETRIIDIEYSADGLVAVDDRGDWNDVLDMLPGLVTVVHSGYWYEKDLNSLDNVDESAGDTQLDQSVGPDTKIRLAHFSVQEYLESSRILDGNAKGFHLDPTREHMYITQSCLVYLTHYSNSAGKTKSKLDLTTFPLLRYAAESWWHHARLQPSDHIFRETAFLTSADKKRDWLRVFDPGSPWMKPFGADWINWDKLAPALYHASLTGLESVAKGLLEAGADVNAQGGRYYTALQAASTGGYGGIVEMLLNAGADVNDRGEMYGTALQVASARGHGGIVEMLLKAGADVNAQGRIYGTALHAALTGGHGGVVEMLLKAGANIH